MADTHGLEPLLAQAQAGDRSAWNTLLGRLRPIVRALLRRQVAQDADASDLTQQVQLRMDRGFAQFRGEAVPQLLAWVRQILARVLIDFHRGKSPPAGPLPEVDDPRSGPSSELVHAEAMARLSAALEKLPDAQRQVIELRLFDRL